MIDLIKENEFIIYSVIKKYLNYFDRDDLYQVGVIGLIEAIKHFNNNKNTKFSSFAYFYVKGEVMKYIRNNNGLKVSKELLDLCTKLEKVRDCLTQKYGYIPSNKEIADYLEIDEYKVDEAIFSGMVLKSLDTSDGEFDLYNTIGYEEKSYKEELIDLRNELSNLSDIDKEIIEKRYNEGLSQCEVSKKLGTSQVKISRMEKKILTRLKSRLS